MAALVVTLVPVNGPLLQQASIIEERSGFNAKNVSISMLREGWMTTGLITGRFEEANTLERDFIPIVKQHNNRVPINMTDTGCDGTCKGVVAGTGYQIRCVNDTVLTYNLTLDPFNAEAEAFST